MSKKLFENLNSQEVWQKLVLVLRPERSFYITTIIYSIGVSVLSLGVPISVQALVNTVTFGVLLQPLIILSFVLLALLIFSGTLNALQYYIVEIFQRHLYTRITVDMTMKLLNVKFKDLEKKNSTKLINRYFDVMTIQKSVTTLLTGGIDIILQTFVGLLLLAFYHPYFLAFDFILVIFLWLSWVLFWKRAVQTAVDESKSKYEVASWLEEMARLNLFFKTEKRKRYALEKTDNKVLDYIENRTRHFRFSFLQNITLLATYAFMSAFVLALGGYLVIEGELTIGQLVAAELVVTVILYNFAKSGKYLLSFYDLYAAVDKISVFYDLKTEDNSEKFEIEKDDLINFDLDLKNVEIKTSATDINFYFNYKFASSNKYFVHTQYYNSKVMLLELIQKLILPDKGEIEFGEHKYNRISSGSIRDNIYVVDKPCVIEGSIEENLTIGQTNITAADINNALEVVDLSHLYQTFKDGLSTKIIASGHPLWSSQVIRLEIARAILLKPKVVIFTETFDQLEKKRRKKIIDYFSNQKTTIIVFSHRDNDQFVMDKYISLTSKEVLEFDSREKMDNFIKENDI